jgi:hypothetical protein
MLCRAICCFHGRGYEDYCLFLLTSTLTYHNTRTHPDRHKSLLNSAVITQSFSSFLQVMAARTSEIFVHSTFFFRIITRQVTLEMQTGHASLCLNVLLFYLILTRISTRRPTSAILLDVEFIWWRSLALKLVHFGRLKCTQGKLKAYFLNFSSQKHHISK